MMRVALRHPIVFSRDHRFTRARASAFLDGDLDPKGRERVQAHMHICPPCARFVATLRDTVAALNALHRSETPNVVDGILARLHQEDEPQDRTAHPGG